MTQEYFAPAEDAPHAGTWMAWPSTAAIYGGGSYYQSVQETLGRLARAIAENEPVWMAAGAEHHALAAQLCGPKVRLVDIETDDMWARDSGPVFLIGRAGGAALADFNFNGWGGKQRHGHDVRLAGRIAEHLGCKRFAASVRGEGGGLEYDGEGTLILTESCWVNDNRNPGLSRAGIEAALKALLGVEVVIWIPGVRGREITDGHIDGSIRIVRPGLLLATADPNRHSEWAQAQAAAQSHSPCRPRRAWAIIRDHRGGERSRGALVAAELLFVLCQLLRRQRCGLHAAVRRPHGRRPGAGDTGTAVPRPKGCRARYGSNLRKWRRHSLRDAAAAGDEELTTSHQP